MSSSFQEVEVSFVWVIKVARYDVKLSQVQSSWWLAAITFLQEQDQVIGTKF